VSEEKQEVEARIVERVCLFPVDCNLKDAHGTVIEMECPSLEISSRGTFKNAHKSILKEMEDYLGAIAKGGPRVATIKLQEKGLGFGYPKEDFDSHRYIMRLPFECSSRRFRFIVPFVLPLMLPVEFLEGEQKRLNESDKEDENSEETT